MTDWKKVKLGEVCEITSSKRIFANEYSPFGIPFYRGKEIIEKQKGNDISTELYISRKKYEDIKSKFDVPLPGDMLLTSVGTLGIPYVVKDNEVFYFKDGNLTWFKNWKNLYNQFIFYWFLSIGKNQIDSKCIGSTQKALTIETLRKFEIIIPPLPKQIAIAETLSCLDDKIELNNRINKNLEAQAQAIFKSWFIDFEPSISFTDVVQVLGGGTPKTTTKEYWNGNIPFFTPKDVQNIYSIATEKYLTKIGLDSCNSSLFPIGTTFITARGTVGKITMAGVPMAINQSCYALVGHVGYGQYFVYHLALNTVERLKHKANGAVFNAIVTRDFESELIPAIPKEIINTFEQKIAPIYELILRNIKESATLAAIRDNLLPKLMNGEIKITDEE